MAVSKQTEEWFAAALENSIAAMRKVRGVKDYEGKDDTIFMAYVLQHFAGYCLVNEETQMNTACRMIGWDAKVEDPKLGKSPRNFFREQWTKAVEFARASLYDKVCRKYFGGIVDARGAGIVNQAVRNAMEKKMDTVKFKDEDGDDTVDHPIKALEKIGFRNLTEELYAEAAEDYRQQLKAYTTLRSKRAPNLTGDVLGGFFQ